MMATSNQSQTLNLITKITTKDIGRKLNEEYAGNDNEPLNHFYLLIFYSSNVSPSQVSTSTEVADKLLAEKGWKKLDTSNAQSLVYFGKFDKHSVDCNERDRESQLNTEIRDRLKRTLREEFGSSLIEEVLIIITRACRYFRQTDPMEVDD